MNLQFSEAELAEMSPEVRAWAIQNGYARGGTPRVGFGLTQGANLPQNMPSSNLGMGGNKPSYLHLDPGPYEGQSIPMSEYGNVPGGAPMSYKDFIARSSDTPSISGTPMSFSDPSIAGTPQTMDQFYARKFPESRPGMSNFKMQGDPMLQGVNPTQTSSYYGADPILTANANRQATKSASNMATQQATDQATTNALKASSEGAGAGDVMTGAKYYGANVATDALINTHNRKKVNTPLGNKGSTGGIVKGGIKGALMGAQLSGGNPYVTAGSAVVGAYTGAQGGFDTEDAPQYQILRARRRSGGGGLLAPEGVYG